MDQVDEQKYRGRDQYRVLWFAAQATLKNLAPSKLMLKPLQSATLSSVPLNGLSKVPKVGEPSSASGKRKRGTKGQVNYFLHSTRSPDDGRRPPLSTMSIDVSQDARKDTTKAVPPPAADIKLPEKYLLIPVPKTSEGSHQV